jgi:hypothetical protein
MYYRDIYLVDLITLDRIQLQFVPYEMAQPNEAMWVGINSPGRNNPFYHFTGGEDILSFTLDYHATWDNRHDVALRCKWVKALSLADGYNGEPHPVKLIWGETLYSEATWIVQSAPYRFTQFNAEKDMMPIQAYQDLTLKRVEPMNTSFEDNLKITR